MGAEALGDVMEHSPAWGACLRWAGSMGKARNGVPGRIFNPQPAQSQSFALALARSSRTSHAVVDTCRRTIHRFDNANSVVSCAMFLARPR